MSHRHGQTTGNLDAFLAHMDAAIVQGSISAHAEGGSDHRMGDARMAVRTYERYSAVGGNRVSLHLCVLAVGEELSVALSTAGGSQAMFFKLNTFGEEAFMDKALQALHSFES